MLLQVQTKCLWEEKTLILPSPLKTLSGDLVDQFFFGHPFPGRGGQVMGVVVSHQFYGMLRRDLMLFHEVVDPRVSFVNFPGLSSPPPGGVFSLLQGLSSFSKVSLVFRQVTSLLVADEALVVLYVLHSFSWREIYFFHLHGIRVPGRLGGSSVLSRWCYIFFSSLLKPLLTPIQHPQDPPP